jgi:predicted DNA-binding antitoxin AbrB/MazE fold protein
VFPAAHHLYLLHTQGAWLQLRYHASGGHNLPAAAPLQSTKLKEQEKANKSLQKEKEQLQAEVRDLKARIKEGTWEETASFQFLQAAISSHHHCYACTSACCAVLQALLLPVLSCKQRCCLDCPAS